MHLHILRGCIGHRDVVLLQRIDELARLHAVGLESNIEEMSKLVCHREFYTKL